MEKLISEKNIKDNYFLSIGKGIIISVILTLVLFFILGLCLANTGISENIIKPSIIIISGVSILIGSSIGMASEGKGGMLKGAILGFLYTFILYLISSIMLKDFSLNIYSFLMFAASLISGAIGGIIGVNKK